MSAVSGHGLEDPAGVRVRVTSGTPTDTELAAVVVALTPSAVDDTGAVRPSGWQRAGILEAHGRALVTQVADLEQPGDW